MYEGKTHTLFVKYAIPQMIGLLFNSVYLIVDGIFIGNRLGRDAMAAAAVSVPFIEILIALSMAVASGAGIMISGQLARNENGRAVQTFNTAILCSAGIGILTAILGNLFLHPLASFLGSTPQIHAEAVSYLWYIVTFSPFLLFSFLLGGLARNDGCPKLAMFALAFGSVSNIVLDYVFMYPLNMGIAGAALATALGPIFSVLILLPHFLMKRGNLHFAKLEIRFCNIQRIFTLGFPSFIMEFTVGIVTFVYNFAIVKHGYGEIGLAAYLVIGYLMLMILTIFLGMAEGLQPVFSYLTGTGETERSQEMRRFAAKIFLGVGILCYLLIVLFSRHFFAIFNPEDMQLIDFMQSKSLYYFCGFFLAGYNILMITYWQSTQCTKRALAVSLARSIVCPPILIMLLPMMFGSEVIWLCHSLSEGLTALIAFGLLRSMSHSASVDNRQGEISKGNN
ncbi:MATE family efflux transporter [Oscillibacter sp. GMB15532]|uniref:MATE family efflux transporter n=1 Tax=Oscillibacter sp. GMB15532 TaxID=3230022 RepID=UPI0034DE0BD4